MSLNIIILAAGQGTRMKSAIPKVLHLLSGVPLLEHVIKTAQLLKPHNIFIVLGHESEKIKQYFKDYQTITWIYQEKQLGTAHAVLQVLPYLKKPDEKVLILYGDVPLLSEHTLKNLLEKTAIDKLGIITALFKHPFGFGRIIRDKNNHDKIIKIIEQKDLSDTQQAIKEINAGIYCLSVKNLKSWLPKITHDNAQQEYYLTDLVNLANHEAECTGLIIQENWEVQGVNDRVQLYELEKNHQKKLADHLRLSGVTILSDNIIIRGDIKNIHIESDVMIDSNVILEGNIHIESGSIIGAHSVIKNTRIGKKTEIKSHCVIEDSVIGDQCKIGPFARLRPGTILHHEVLIGNFVEVKNSDIHPASKIPHLSYIGDTDMGKHVNIGAGVITCNYDGAKKHRTVIGDNVFVGSDSQLIAPVTIEEGAYIGSGSTITKTAPAGKLTLTRTPQKTVEGWKKPEV